MSFAGHVMDMVTRSRSNRNLLLAKRKRRKRLRENYIQILKKNGCLIKNKAPRELCEQVKSEIRRKIKKEHRKRMLIVYCVFITLVLLLVFVFSKLL